MNHCECIGTRLIESKIITEKDSSKPVINAEMECVEVSVRTCGTARTYNVISVTTDDNQECKLMAPHQFCPFCGIELIGETEFEKEFLEKKK